MVNPKSKIQNLKSFDDRHIITQHRGIVMVFDNFRRKLRQEALLWWDEGLIDAKKVSIAANLNLLQLHLVVLLSSLV